jgi:hypothetical protein
MRVNSWVSIIVFLVALAFFLRQRGKPRSRATDGAVGPDPQVSEGEPQLGQPEPEPSEEASLNSDVTDEAPARREASDEQYDEPVTPDR